MKAKVSDNNIFTISVIRPSVHPRNFEEVNPGGYEIDKIEGSKTEEDIRRLHGYRHLFFCREKTLQKRI